MKTAPRFAVIKDFILNKIEQREWLAGQAIPSENQLAEMFGVSRMTARRALSELTETGVLERRQGTGSFVAEQLPTGSLLEIRSIATEIEGRGHTHRAQVIELASITVTQSISQLLLLPVDDVCGFSRVVHFENDTAIQLEDRYINLQAVPDYLSQDFSHETPSSYLNRITPLSDATHWVEAVLAPKDICQLLSMEAATPCLKVSRRTYSRAYNTSIHPDKNTTNSKDNPDKHVVNFSYLYHPGDRYRLGGSLHTHN